MSPQLGAGSSPDSFSVGSVGAEMVDHYGKGSIGAELVYLTGKYDNSVQQKKELMINDDQMVAVQRVVNKLTNLLPNGLQTIQIDRGAAKIVEDALLEISAVDDGSRAQRVIGVATYLIQYAQFRQNADRADDEESSSVHKGISKTRKEIGLED